MPVTHTSDDIIEGVFKVVATRELPRPFARSPNRQRLAARILFWNAALACAAIFLPVVLS